MAVKRASAVVEIVRAETMTQAARNLDRTQPALTHQVQALEEELRCSVFRRQGRKLTLTREGERIHALALEILERVDAARQVAERDGAEVAGILRIGAGSVMGGYCLPLLVGKFLERYPEVRFSVLESPSAQLPILVRLGQVDMALGYEIPCPQQVVFETLHEDELRLVCARGNPLARVQRLGAERLSRTPFIRYRPDTPVQRAIKQRLRLTRGGQSLSLEMSSTASVLNLVQRDLGVALVPALLLRMLKPRGVASRVFQPRIPLALGLYRARQKFLPRVLQTFLDFTRRRWRECVP